MLRRHVVIVGCGWLGFEVAKKAISWAEKVTIIDKDKERCKVATSSLPVYVFCGDVSDSSLLEEAEVGTAEVVIITTPDDKLNVQLATFIKEKYKVRRIFVVLRDVEILKRYKEALNKTEITAILVNELVVSEIMGKLRPGGWSTIYLSERTDFEIVKAIVYEDSKALGKKVQEFNVKNDAFIAIIIRDGNVLKAKDNLVLERGDEVFIAGKKTSVEALLEYF